MKKTSFLLFFVLPFLLINCSNEHKLEFAEFPKFDAHVHIDSFDEGFAEIAKEHNFKLLTLVTRSASREHIDREFTWAHHQHLKNPDIVYFSTTIGMENRKDPDWQNVSINIPTLP